MAGLVGSGAGAGLGIVMAWVIAAYMSRTLAQTVGFEQRVTELSVDPKLLAAGMVIEVRRTKKP